MSKIKWRNQHTVEFLTVYTLRRSNDVCVAFRDIGTRQCFDRIYMTEEWDGTLVLFRRALEHLREKPKETFRIDMPGTADDGDAWLCIGLTDMEKMVSKMEETDRRIKAQRTVEAVADSGGQPEITG